MKKDTKNNFASSNKEFRTDMAKAYKKKKTTGGVFGAVNRKPKFTPSPTQGAPVAQMPQMQQPMMKKNKASKKKGTKKKVSHVLQETSMCKKCKTSHKPNMHKTSGGVKKKH